MAVHTAKDHRSAGDEAPRRFKLGDNARGAIIMIAGALALMGLAFGGMLLLTSPNGWVTKAANGAVSGEEIGLVPVSFAFSD